MVVGNPIDSGGLCSAERVHYHSSEQFAWGGRIPHRGRLTFSKLVKGDNISFRNGGGQKGENFLGKGD